MKLISLKPFSKPACLGIIFLIMILTQLFLQPAILNAETQAVTPDGNDSDNAHSAVQIRPLKELKVMVPAPEVSKIFENGRFVMVNYSEFMELVEKNNKLSKKYDILNQGADKNPPVDYIVTGAEYKFIKDGDNILGSADIDFSILNGEKYIIVPLISGRIAMTDAVIDDTIPTMLVKPLYGETMNEMNRSYYQQPVQQISQSYSNVQQLGNISANSIFSDKIANQYLIAIKGKGSHNLNIKFLLTPEKEDATQSFMIGTPVSAKNKVTVLHDEKNAVINISPAIGLNLYHHQETKNQAASAEFGFSDRLKISYFAITSEERRMMDAARQADKPSATASGTDSVSISATDAATSEISAASGQSEPAVESEAPVTGCVTKTLFSAGDGMFKGRHELNFNVIKGKISKISLTLPAETEIDDIIYSNYDKRQIREFSGYSSVEIFFKSPVNSNFTMTINTLTKISDEKSGLTMPEIKISDLDTERGYIGICASTNIKITQNGLAENLERIDAYELPDGMSNLTASPILYAYKYFKHPYKTEFSFIKYNDSPVLSTLLSQSAVNTVIASDGTAISSFKYVMKNNGMPFLRVVPADTLEVLDSSVKNKTVKASIDSESNIKIPIVKSDFFGDSISEFPVNFKASAPVQKLALAGRLQLELPRVEIPMMNMKWRIFTPEGYIFYNMHGNPDLVTNPPEALLYQIPLNAFYLATKLATSEAMFNIIFIALFAALLYLLYLGWNNSLTASSWQAITKKIAEFLSGLFNWLKNHAVSIIVLFTIVIVIASIATPNFNRARTQSVKKACVSNLKTIEGAMELLKIEDPAQEQKVLSSSDGVRELVYLGYLKLKPVCPNNGEYRISKNADGKFDFACTVHGPLYVPAEDLKEEREIKNERMKEIPSAPPEAANYDSFQSPIGGEKKSKLYKNEINAPEGSYDKAPAELKSGTGKGQFEDRLRSEENIPAAKKSALSKIVPGQFSVLKPEADKGVFSVSVPLPKTSHSTIFEKEFVSPGEKININISYMTADIFRILNLVLAVMGIIMIYVFHKALINGNYNYVYICVSLIIFLIMELANHYIPQTARSSKNGIFVGIAGFLILKLIAFIGTPGNFSAILSFMKAKEGDMKADNELKTQADEAASQNKSSDGSNTPAKNIITIFIFTLISIAIAGTCLALSADTAAAAPKNVKYDITYNPATREIQAYYPYFFSDRDLNVNNKVIILPYSDMQSLVEAVNALEYSPDTAEALYEKPSFTNVIKKINITGSITTELAALDIEYFIDVFNDKYETADLISGDIAIKNTELYLIKPFNFGFYDVSENFIRKLEKMYDGAAREKISQSRQAKSFEKIATKHNIKIGSNLAENQRAAGQPEMQAQDISRLGQPAYSVIFDEKGEYLVKVSLKTNVTFSENSYYFNLNLPLSPCVKINLKSPAEYDIVSDCLICESQTKLTDENLILTRGSLVPYKNYKFKLSLGEEIKRERALKKQAEEQEIRRKLIENMGLQSSEVKIITQKLEPKVHIISTQLLTLDDERFTSKVNFSYNIQNTELSEIAFKIPALSTITSVDTRDMYSWKINNDDATSENKILKIKFKKAVSGQLSIKLTFEKQITGSAQEISAPIISPVSFNEYKGFLILDSAVNAELTVLKTTNLVEIDETEALNIPARNTLTPVIASYRFTKFPIALNAKVQKHTDIASVPCVIDLASYRSVITREGYLMTEAQYKIRNNTVQFLEIMLPEKSAPWSLNVAGKLKKPGASSNIIYIPLIKSPFINQKFQPFTVTFTYATPLDKISDMGSTKLLLPKVNVICSKIIYEMDFLDNYSIFNLNTNLRKEKSRPQAEFIEEEPSAEYIDQSRRLISNTRAATQGSIVSVKDIDRGSILMSGSARGILPVPVTLPCTSNRIYFSGETLKKPESAAAAPQYYVEFSYLSKEMPGIILYIAYFAGVVLIIWLHNIMKFGGSYSPYLKFTLLTVIYLAVTEYYAITCYNYLFSGLIMGVLILLTTRIVKLTDIERRTLKLK